MRAHANKGFRSASDYRQDCRSLPRGDFARGLIEHHNIVEPHRGHGIGRRFTFGAARALASERCFNAPPSFGVFCLAFLFGSRSFSGCLFYETKLMPMLCTPLWTWPPHGVELRSIGTENISK